MKVAVEIAEVRIATDRGMIPSVCVTCSRCRHAEESYGTKEKSVRRCLYLLQANCPKGEINYYGPDRFDFSYHGDCELTEAIRAEYERELARRAR
jgi:hypothetical protein